MREILLNVSAKHFCKLQDNSIQEREQTHVIEYLLLLSLVQVNTKQVSNGELINSFASFKTRSPSAYPSSEDVAIGCHSPVKESAMTDSSSLRASFSTRFCNTPGSCRKALTATVKFSRLFLFTVFSYLVFL